VKLRIIWLRNFFLLRNNVMRNGCGSGFALALKLICPERERE
jgi:hypothetical protein